MNEEQGVGWLRAEAGPPVNSWWLRPTWRRKNGLKWLDFWHILMVGLMGFADALGAVEDEGESSIAPWYFARGT